MGHDEIRKTFNSIVDHPESVLRELECIASSNFQFYSRSSEVAEVDVVPVDEVAFNSIVDHRTRFYHEMVLETTSDFQFYSRSSNTGNMGKTLV